MREYYPCAHVARVVGRPAQRVRIGAFSLRFLQPEADRARVARQRRSLCALSSLFLGELAALESRFHVLFAAWLPQAQPRRRFSPMSGLQLRIHQLA